MKEVWKPFEFQWHAFFLKVDGVHLFDDKGIERRNVPWEEIVMAKEIGATDPRTIFLFMENGGTVGFQVENVHIFSEELKKRNIQLLLKDGPNFRFDEKMPIKEGTRFILTADWKTHALTHWKAPATFGEDCIVPKGTELIALHDLVAAGVGVRPVKYAELECILIPEKTRRADKYGGYSLVLMFKDIGKIANRL